MCTMGIVSPSSIPGVCRVGKFPFSGDQKPSNPFISLYSKQRFVVAHCCERPIDRASAYSILGVEPRCSNAELKAAFRSKVKRFHPDVNRGEKESDSMTRRVIEAYELLVEHRRSETNESEYMDPFDEPECQALDIFVNEFLCIGRGCPYSCVEAAPNVFSFDSSTGTARATVQGFGGDYRVQVAVGRCPRSCIYNVTPYQRVILEEMLESILEAPYDTSAEQDSLYSLITKARFQNNRFQQPKS